MQCAIRLEKINLDKLVGSVNRIVEDYFKEEGDADGALLVISIAKVVDHGECESAGI